MLQIENITEEVWQKHTIILENGELFTFELYFASQQIAWYFKNITYQNFVLNSIKVVNSINLLNQFSQILPFGIACLSISDRDPNQVEDFTSGYSSLYLLTEADLVTYGENLSAG